MSTRNAQGVVISAFPHTRYDSKSSRGKAISLYLAFYLHTGCSDVRTKLLIMNQIVIIIGDTQIEKARFIQSHSIVIQYVMNNS